MGIIKKEKKRQRQKGYPQQSSGASQNKKKQESSPHSVIKRSNVSFTDRVIVPKTSFAFRHLEEPDLLSYSPEIESASEELDQGDPEALSFSSSSQEASIETAVPVSVPVEPVMSQQEKQNWEEKVQQSYYDGYDKAKEELQEDHDDKIKSHAQDVLVAINEMVGHKTSVIEKTKGQLLTYGIQIAQRIIQKEVTSDPTILKGILDEALAKLTDTDKVIIRVNKDDLLFVQERLDEIKTLISGVKTVIAQEDATVLQGGCIIETDLGYVDATLKTKFKLIEEALGGRSAEGS